MEETIVAISTPPGEGGVGIIRISGPQAIPIAQQLFLSTPPIGSRIRYVEYGKVSVEGQEIDTALAWAFRAPRSYTGEDTVEISCHGSTIILELVVNEAIKLGARTAAPGEFTRRAFLNGQLDLLQAEAVVDLIQASSESGLEDAYSLAGGRLSKEVRTLKKSLVESLAKVEVGLDFSEEDIDPISRHLVGAELEAIVRRARQLVDSFAAGRRRMQGYLIALVGRPNVGKSTLLNALLDEERAIVTEIPGTTRDLIEGRTAWEGRSIRLVDTAGLRASPDPIEAEGIFRAKKMADEADLVLLVIDAMEDDIGRELQLCQELHHKQCLVVFNKIDQRSPAKSGALFGNRTVVEISALTGVGMEELRKVALALLPRDLSAGGVVLTRQRHRECLLSMMNRTESACQLLDTGQPDECVAAELQEALHSLGALLGERVDEDVLDAIFAEFCIGK